MDLTKERHRKKQKFIDTGYNLTIGSLDHVPFTLEELKSIDESSPLVKEVYDSGLTAIIYHLEKDGSSYNLKKKRTISKVQNLDGEYSFLNEVMRRNDFHFNYNKTLRTHVSPTIYANYLEGIMLYPWIYGSHPDRFSYQQYLDLFHTLFEMERNNLFEWDLCKGNILIEENQNVILFDFGYNYEYDPLHMYNSNGLDSPEFHMMERLETRALMELWLKIEENEGEQALLEQIKLEKAAGLIVYIEKLKWLKENNASTEVLSWQERLIDDLREYLQGPDECLGKFYAVRKEFYMRDIEDDISGKSCTVETLAKINKLISLSTTQEEKNQYNSIKESVIKYQLKR